MYAFKQAQFHSEAFGCICTILTSRCRQRTVTRALYSLLTGMDGGHFSLNTTSLKVPLSAYSASIGRAGQFAVGIGFSALSKNQTSCGKDSQQNKVHCSFCSFFIHSKTFFKVFFRFTGFSFVYALL